MNTKTERFVMNLLALVLLSVAISAFMSMRHPVEMVELTMGKTNEVRITGTTKITSVGTSPNRPAVPIELERAIHFPAGHIQMCFKCLRGQDMWEDMHDTILSGSMEKGCIIFQAMCNTCWTNSTIEERLRIYKWRFDSLHNPNLVPYYPLSGWATIEQAVREGK